MEISEFKDFNFDETVAWMVFYGDDLSLHTITTDKEKVARYLKQNYIIIDLKAVPVDEKETVWLDIQPCVECGSTECNGECMGDGQMGG